MATRKTKAPVAKEKQYIVLCEGELWVRGTKQDIINDFNEDPDLYMREEHTLKIYELPEPIPFSFVTPQITF